MPATLAFKAVPAEKGTRRADAAMADNGSWATTIAAERAEFIAELEASLARK